MYSWAYIIQRNMRRFICLFLIVSDNSDLFLFSFVSQGITNTVGAVPGIVGVALTGYLLDTTHSWSVSCFFLVIDLFSQYDACISFVFNLKFIFIPCRYHYMHHRSSSIWVGLSYGWCLPAVSLKVFLRKTDSWFNHLTKPYDKQIFDRGSVFVWSSSQD